MKKNVLYSAAVLFIMLVVGCNRVSRYPIDDPARVKIDNTLLGKWLMKEDTAKGNYFIVAKKNDFKYNVTYMSQGGTHVQYENFEVFLSKISGMRFLNVQYYYESVQGYFFLKLQDINEAGDEITCVPIADSTLSEITEPAQVRARINRNIDNPVFFADTVHFLKIKGF